MIMTIKKEASWSANLSLAPRIEQEDYNILVQIEQELNADFVPYQKYSTQLARSYERLALSSNKPKDREYYSIKGIKVNFCGSYLDFAIGGFTQDGYDSFEKAKLYRANFCKDRLCPQCNARRSKKIVSQLLQVMEYLEPKYSFLFLTLTIPNVNDYELSDAFELLHNSWNKYIRYTRIKNAVQGYVRTLEVTYNDKANTFHPHYHVILAVDKKYFKGQNYIKQEEWQNLWSKATKMKVEAVHIEKIKPKDEKHGNLISSVLETAKYSVKAVDYLKGDYNESISDKTDYLIKTLNSCLEQVKMISFGGCFQKARAQLRQDNLENGNLTKLEKDTLQKYYALLLEHYQRRPQQINYERIDETIEVLYNENE